jgi:hypothetical protein
MPKHVTGAATGAAGKAVAGVKNATAAARNAGQKGAAMSAAGRGLGAKNQNRVSAQKMLGKIKAKRGK